MPDQELTQFRFDKLEKSHEEILKQLANQDKRQAIIETELGAIKGLMKWTLGGIFSAILMALGKFIISGKLAP